MYASSASMVGISFYVTAGIALRRTILSVLNETSRSFGQTFDGTVVGIYVTSVREMLFLCAIHAHTPCARDVLSRLISFVSEGTKDSVKHA